MFPDYNFTEARGHHLIFKVFHIVVLIFFSKVISYSLSPGKSGSSNKSVHSMSSGLLPLCF